MDQLKPIVRHLRVIHQKNGVVKRDNLATPGDIYHIKKEFDSFIDFCEAYEFRTTFSKRLPKHEQKQAIIAIIKQLKEKTGRIPTSRDVKEEMRHIVGRSTIKFRFNDLLIEAGCAISRNNYLQNKQDVLSELRKYFNEYGRYPYAEELKSTIGIVPNSKTFNDSGGYVSFLIENSLINEDIPIRCGRITIKPTVGHDGRRYCSKCEAIFADLLFRNKINYLSQVGVGRFNGKIPLTIDFLVPHTIPLAVEIDGMGPLRGNIPNVIEKRSRCEKRGWKWMVLNRDKVRALCRKKLVSLDTLDSLAKT